MPDIVAEENDAEEIGNYNAPVITIYDFAYLLTQLKKLGIELMDSKCKSHRCHSQFRLYDA